MEIMFVCTGNSCRSPMAELYFNELCRKDGGTELRASSAGIMAWPGEPISILAEAVMTENHIDASAFQSRRLNPKNCAAADFIVAMTARHAAAIREAFPEAAGKLRLLSDFSPDRKGGDIPDPYGGTIADYRHIFSIMKASLDHLYKQLKGSLSHEANDR